MSKLSAGLMLLSLIATSAFAAEPVAKTVYGMNEALAAGSRALQLGDFEAGVRLTLEGLDAEHRGLTRAQALSNLCAGYTGLEDYEKALAACDEAIAMHSRNWRFFNNRALALAGIGRIEDARRSLEMALAMRPDSPKLAKTRIWIDQHAPRTVLAGGRQQPPLTQ